MDLAQRKCVACEGGIPPLSREQAQAFMPQIKGWTLSGDSRWLSKEFKFKDFAEAFALAGKIADLAEREGHHPELQISWGKLVVELTTHALKGLSDNDFIMAAKIDALQS